MRADHADLARTGPPCLILQRQLSNGRWADCAQEGDTDARWLAMCVEHTPGIASVEEAVAALLAGRQLRNDAADWYSWCRAKPAPAPAPAPVVDALGACIGRGKCPNPRDCGDPTCRGECGY